MRIEAVFAFRARPIMPPNAATPPIGAISYDRESMNLDAQTKSNRNNHSHYQSWSKSGHHTSANTTHNHTSFFIESDKRGRNTRIG
jgi:hypothetical protein